MALSCKGAHFPQDIMLRGVRWYLAYPLSDRHVEALMAECGVRLDHATIQRWVVKYSPLLEAAIKSYNEEHGTIMYLNNVVAQDHRAIKRVTRPMLGFKAFEATQAALTGLERMHRPKKKQMVIEARDEGLTAAELFDPLAA